MKTKKLFLKIGLIIMIIICVLFSIILPQIKDQIGAKAIYVILLFGTFQLALIIEEITFLLFLLIIPIAFYVEILMRTLIWNLFPLGPKMVNLYFNPQSCLLLICIIITIIGYKIKQVTKKDLLEYKNKEEKNI